jgi:uncharacterized protein involved in exopolysaccharide biosynthesis
MSQSRSPELPAGSPTSQESGFELLDLIKEIFSNYRKILLSTVVATVIGITYAYYQENIYRAEAVIIPAGARQSGSSLAGQLGGAAALVGINIQSGANSDPVTTALAVMNSREFLVNFIKEHDVLVPLFAGYWDADTRNSKVDSSIYNAEQDLWIDGQPPTDLQAYRAFLSILTVSAPDPSSGIVRVSIRWHDPILAKTWVNELINEINAKIKTRDLEEARDAITFLQNQLAATKLVEMQRVFYQLIESQTRVTMLADVREEYVFQIIDPAVVPDQIVAPKRLLIVLITSILGIVLSVTFIVFRHLGKEQN